MIKATSGSSVDAARQYRPVDPRVHPGYRIPGDPGFHGPKWSNYNQLIGAFKYTLRLQERVVGRGPDVPQVPVIPSPTEPGEWAVHGSRRGRRHRVSSVQPNGPAPGPAPVAPAAPAVEPAP